MSLVVLQSLSLRLFFHWARFLLADVGEDDNSAKCVQVSAVLSCIQTVLIVLIHSVIVGTESKVSCSETKDCCVSFMVRLLMGSLGCLLFVLCMNVFSGSYY